MIQAVDNRGNVTWLDYTAATARPADAGAGAYSLPSSGVPLGIPAPIDVTLSAPVSPTISHFTPTQGAVGTLVTISGSYLAGATELDFAGVPATIATNTETRITATVPAGAPTGPIRVVTPAGTATSAAVFTVTPPPSLSINDLRAREGNAGVRNAILRVWLSAPSSQPVTVGWQTANGTATTAGNDYTAASGTLTFGPYIRSRTILVSIRGDTAPEANEAFFVDLGNPTNAAITRGRGRVTIVNDDR